MCECHDDSHSDEGREAKDEEEKPQKCGDGEEERMHGWGWRRMGGGMLEEGTYEDAKIQECGGD